MKMKEMVLFVYFDSLGFHHTHRNGIVAQTIGMGTNQSTFQLTMPYLA